jgi:threonine synthase
MITYLSTRNKNSNVTSTRAILNGLAPDGGLYVPDNTGELKADYHDIITKDYKGMAEYIFGLFFNDFSKEDISKIIERSYTGKFGSDKITPLVKVGDRFILELFHGPTCAFKDVALSALPNLMTVSREYEDFTDEVLILTATSGDTGSAALYGFSDVPGTRIIVFFPDGGVSETQKLQMVTQSGSNTCVCAVRGNFDDAQTGVKKIFRNVGKPCDGVSLSSANSINIGRLVPQVTYYFAAYKELVESGEITDGDKVDFTVPTGNFGDIMAGYFAKVIGLPVGKLICASNSNDVLTEFLETGHYNRKREFYKTTSPSMDILVSSNLERLIYFVCGPEKTASYMKELNETGEYTIAPDELAEITSVFEGISRNDAQGAEAIGKVFKEYGYLMDTHTAIAWAASEKRGGNGNANVILSTASPYKFTGSVLEALGEKTVPSDRDNMARLEEVTGIEPPAPLKGIFEREIRHRDVIDVPDMQDYVIAKANER